MSDIECPYCGEWMDADNEDYPDVGDREDEWYHKECPHCEKTFAYSVEIQFSFTGQKADCLNGGEHKFEKTNTFPERFSRLRCSDCGKEKPIPEE